MANLERKQVGLVGMLITALQTRTGAAVQSIAGSLHGLIKDLTQKGTDFDVR